MNPLYGLAVAAVVWGLWSIHPGLVWVLVGLCVLSWLVVRKM